MRKILAFILVFVLVFTLGITVSADSASSASTYASVSKDRTCQITMTVKIRLDQAASGLTFPIPGNAESVTVNGERVRTQKKNDSLLIDLGDHSAGEFVVTVGYSLSEVVQPNSANQLQLQLPLLNGLAYPIASFDFSVTLPGEITNMPAFSSGYHQADIEKDLNYTVSGATISGTSQKELKDHETLVMTLIVPDEMFPQMRAPLPDVQVLTILMVVFAVLAIAYWLVFLRCPPLYRTLCPTPPEGQTAGQLASILTLSGADLSLMILSWAQLGYLQIQLDRRDRVTLHKRMDMGNERSEFERRCFKLLFGKRTRVAAGGRTYWELCQRVQKMRPPISAFFHSRSGNPRLFRFLAAAVGLFGGVSLGLFISVGAALQWFFVILLGVAGGYSAWLIQNWVRSLRGSDRTNLWIAMACCACWIILGVLSKNLLLGCLMPILQLFFGLMAAFGGRRTEEGLLVSQQILGLRWYLCHTDKQEFARLSNTDPDYFHNMLPYAVALGVDNIFAKRFSKAYVTQSPYLTVGNRNALTAPQWRSLLRRTIAIMRSGQPQKKPLAFLQKFIKR